jgi:DNA repair protein REV1
MEINLSASSSQSFEGFELDDPDILQALNEAEQREQNSRKRARSETPELANEHGGDSPNKATRVPAYLDSEVYAASKFGGIGDFMRRKRAKLQIQNAQIDERGGREGGSQSRIFNGLAIYVRFPPLIALPSHQLIWSQINGWTEPSIQELRSLIVLHGGIFQPYLDQKKIVYVLLSPCCATLTYSFT